MIALTTEEARDQPRCFVTSNVNARRVERILRAIEGQGLAFVELRTPPRDLATDERGLIIIPPVELFGAARPRTADVLDGTAETTWGWPR